VTAIAFAMLVRLLAPPAAALGAHLVVVEERKQPANERNGSKATKEPAPCRGDGHDSGESIETYGAHVTSVVVTMPIATRRTQRARAHPRAVVV
jgi:hypothetical protein